MAKLGGLQAGTIEPEDVAGLWPADAADEVAVDAFFAAAPVVVTQIARSWRGQQLLVPARGGLTVTVGAIDYVTDGAGNMLVDDDGTPIVAR